MKSTAESACASRSVPITPVGRTRLVRRMHGGPAFHKRSDRADGARPRPELGASSSLTDEG